MQVVKRVFLIGNGFNYLTADIIGRHNGQGISRQSYERKEECVNNILFLTKLWERFDEAFDELKRETKGLGDEELIGIIQCVINFFSCLEGLTDNVDISKLQSLISEMFDKFLVQKVIDIASDFRHHEGIADYKSIKQYFKALPNAIEVFVNKNPEYKFNLYTTNYDGILETVFAKDRVPGGTGFIAEDGFIRKISENAPFLALDRTRLENSKMKFLHLHGSYKFAKVFGMTCKISGPAENKNPVMVFNRPTQKGNLVRGDDVLSTYFEKLRRDLSTCDKFIILGNSMKNEPHIKELLSNSIREDATIVVCSRNPAEIKSEIEPHVNCKIVEASTRNVLTEEALIDFLKEVLA